VTDLTFVTAARSHRDLPLVVARATALQRFTPAMLLPTIRLPDFGGWSPTPDSSAICGVNRTG
jgi:hypothetical protein